MIKSIVFDFDGVIVRRSEFLKQEAWAELFPPGTLEGAEFERAEKQHGQGRGGDRFDIIRQVYQNAGKLSGESLEQCVVDAVSRFDALVQEKILSAGIDAQDKQALVELSGTYLLFLNSATPVDALTRTVRDLGLDMLFKGIFGRPLSKVENLKKVAEQEQSAPQEILFVGDGEADMKAAREFGCAFVGVGNEWNGLHKKSREFPVVKDLKGIEKVVSSLK